MLGKIKKIFKRIFESKDEKELRLIKSKLKNTECKYKAYLEDSKKLDGKIALITGGSGAIGSETAFKLAMNGATVIITGRNQKNLDSVVKQISENGGKVESYMLDITNYDDISNIFDKIISKYKKIDILANIAGGSARGEHNVIEKESIDSIDSVLNSNLRATILCCKKIIPIMKKNHFGRIINIGSVMGENGCIGYSDYAAAKSGIIGFTKSLAMELAKDGITVNAVSPGITSQIIWDMPIKTIKTDKNYVGYTGKTEDVANAIAFLCYDESNYIIGQNIIVDGGRSLGLKGE